MLAVASSLIRERTKMFQRRDSNRHWLNYSGSSCTLCHTRPVMVKKKEFIFLSQNYHLILRQTPITAFTVVAVWLMKFANKAKTKTALQYNQLEVAALECQSLKFECLHEYTMD